MKDNKKGFTLVELLAVMVIISVLLLLALPAVTKQIQQARKRTFAEDAQTIASAVKDDLLIGDKALTSNGQISGYDNIGEINNLLDKKLGKSPFGGEYTTAKAEVTVSKDSSTGKRNYSIRICLVDSDGNGFGYSSVENLDAESISIGGVSSTCKPGYEATTILEDNNQNNPNFVSTTIEPSNGSQLPNNQDITESRFTGDNSLTKNNYVYFNCSDTSDQSASTCSLYRIIGKFTVENGYGVFENRLKLISVEEIKAPAPNAGKWDANGSNDWTKSSLKDYLNTTFYASINEKYRALIGDTKYYLGGAPNANVTRSQMYNYERKASNDTINYYHPYNEDSTYWIGKVALPYASDFGYATEKASCDSVNLSNYNTDESVNGCGNNWIWRIDYSPSPSWLITQVSSKYNDAYYIDNTGMSESASVSGSDEPAHPVFYLTSTAEIVGGDGSIGNPYKLFK